MRWSALPAKAIKHGRGSVKSEFREGDLIIYRNGNRYEIGLIKRITDDGAFVWYHEGDTAAKTSFEDMHKIVNAHTIKETSLGGRSREAHG